MTIAKTDCPLEIEFHEIIFIGRPRLMSKRYNLSIDLFYPSINLRRLSIPFILRDNLTNRIICKVLPVSHRTGCRISDINFISSAQ